MAIRANKLLITHACFPLLALILVSAAMMQWDVDQMLADSLYALEGNSWAWKNNWLIESVLHKGGRTLSILCVCIVLIFLLLSCLYSVFSYFTRALLYLVLSAIGSTSLVSVLKFSLAVSCPWEFDRYGGSVAYSNVFQQLLLRNGDGCFPAGHASAGYAWVSLYFIGLHYHSRWRWLGLASAIGFGILFGFAQQLRGAHFISHDIWTLAICWFFSFGLYLLCFRTTTNNRLLPELSCQ